MIKHRFGFFSFLRWVWMHTIWLKQKWKWYFKYRVRAFLCWGRTQICVCVNISNFHVNARFQFEAIRFECTMPALNKCCTCVLNTDYSNGNKNNSDIQWWRCRCRCRRWWKAIARAGVASKCWICVKNVCYTIKNTFRNEIKMGAVWWFRSFVQCSTHRMLRCKKCGLNASKKICAHYDENNLHTPLTRVWCHCRHRYFSFTSHKKLFIISHRLLRLFLVAASSFARQMNVWCARLLNSVLFSTFNRSLSLSLSPSLSLTLKRKPFVLDRPLFSSELRTLYGCACLKIIRIQSYRTNEREKKQKKGKERTRKWNNNNYRKTKQNTKRNHKCLWPINYSHMNKRLIE